jgi:hypothetical protein
MVNCSMKSTYCSGFDFPTFHVFFKFTKPHITMTPFLQYTPYHHRTSNMSKIIIVMAYGREEVMQKFQKAGAVDFLLKSEPVLAV